MLTHNLSSFVANVGVNGTKSLTRNEKTPMNDRQIAETAKDFEALFVAQMLEHMFGESIGTELFGDDDTSEVYKTLMVEQYAQEISRSGGIGIADYVKKELLRFQEV